MVERELSATASHLQERFIQEVWETVVGRYKARKQSESRVNLA